MSAAPVSLSDDSVMFPCCGGRWSSLAVWRYNWTHEEVPLDVNVSKYELLEDGSLRIHSLSLSLLQLDP